MRDEKDIATGHSLGDLTWNDGRRRARKYLHFRSGLGEFRVDLEPHFELQVEDLGNAFLNVDNILETHCISSGHCCNQALENYTS